MGKIKFFQKISTRKAGGYFTHIKLCIILRQELLPLRGPLLRELLL